MALLNNENLTFWVRGIHYFPLLKGASLKTSGYRYLTASQNHSHLDPNYHIA